MNEIEPGADVNSPPLPSLVIASSADFMSVAPASASVISRWALLSLVLGIGSWVLLPFIGSLGAVACGHIALRDIRRSNGQQDGKGFAIAGLILGYAQLALILLAIAVMLCIFLAFMAAAH